MQMFTEHGSKPVKAWVDGVLLDENAKQQLMNTAKLPIIHKWVAAMPDVHWGLGATIGSVIPTKSAIIPAAVGVDIGCGMCAVRTSLTASDLPDDLSFIRSQIEKFVPHGRSNRGGRGDKGAWGTAPKVPEQAWKRLHEGYDRLIRDYPKLKRNAHPVSQLGTLGGGNHFIEVCLDEDQRVWFMLHSGSRGVGNRIGQMFIALAQKDMRHHIQNLPDKNLAYFEEGAEHFDDYVEAVHWAQDYARINRDCMMQAVIEAVRKSKQVPQFTMEKKAVNCHHNYVAKETHYGEEVFITRKGAVNADKGKLGIIPGSMGAKSFIVCGKGHPESFCSCSHGAGRVMSRSQAKKQFTVADHEKATEGVECRKDEGVIDETPAAYKNIDAVMLAQADLVDIVHTLKQVVCVKG